MEEDFILERYIPKILQKNRFYLIFDKYGSISFDSGVCGIFCNHKNKMFGACVKREKEKIYDNISGFYMNPNKCFPLEDALNTAEVCQVRDVHEINKHPYQYERNFNEMYFRFANSPVYVLISAEDMPFPLILNVHQKMKGEYVEYEELDYAEGSEITDVEIKQEHKDTLKKYLTSYFDGEKEKVKHAATRHIVKNEFKSYRGGIDFDSNDRMNDSLVDIVKA